MSAVPAHTVKRLREQLLGVKYPEVLLWSDEDLIDAIYGNGSSWIELLKWLLGELDNEIKEKLESVGGEELLSSIKENIIGLGLCSTTAANRFISDKVIFKEREEFCSKILELVTSKRIVSAGGMLNIDAEESKLLFDSLLVLKVFNSFEKPQLSKGKKKGINIQPSSSSPSTEKDSLINRNAHLQKCISEKEEGVKKKRQELWLKDDNITAFDYLEQLLEERESKLGRLASVTKSVQNLWKTVDELYKSELQALLPVEVMEPIEMPELSDLSEKVDCLAKFQEDQETVEKCTTLLQDRLSIDLEGAWSVKNTASHPLVDLQKQAHSITKIQNLENQPLPFRR